MQSILLSTNLEKKNAFQKRYMLREVEEEESY
jgi:hypothetical protein